MTCNFEITEAELRAALGAIEQAKEQGFSHSTAVFHLSHVSTQGSDTVASFSDSVILKADPTDPAKNWGIVRVCQIGFYSDVLEKK
jgi:hypothetical protein